MANGNRPSVGERLRIARKLRDITQIELAAASGVYSEQISDYEKERYPVPERNLVKLARGLKVSIEYLLGLADTPWPPQKDDAIDTSGLTMADIELLQKMAEVMAERNQNAIAA